jgi:PII-like signaling protein
MSGYQLTFYTEQSRKIHHQPVGEWLLNLVKSLNIGGATLNTAVSGVGHDNKLHSAYFFDLADQPIQVTVVTSEKGCATLFERLNAEEGLHLFYVKIPVEYGFIGKV